MCKIFSNIIIYLFQDYLKELLATGKYRIPSSFYTDQWCKIINNYLLLKIINISHIVFLRLSVSKYKIYSVNVATTVYGLTPKVIATVFYVME